MTWSAETKGGASSEHMGIIKCQDCVECIQCCCLMTTQQHSSITAVQLSKGNKPRSNMQKSKTQTPRPARPSTAKRL
jgi:hypothetical protein